MGGDSEGRDSGLGDIEPYRELELGTPCPHVQLVARS